MTTEVVSEARNLSDPAARGESHRPAAPSV